MACLSSACAAARDAGTPWADEPDPPAPADDGLELELYYTAEVLANVSGGAHRKAEYLGDVDLLLTADLERLFGWEGGTLFLYGLGVHGGSISHAVGDLQGVSNIEAPDTVTLFEAWVEQSFLGDEASLLAGLYDVNGEFDVIPAASLFLSSSHGIGADFGLSGKNGPSIFPVTSLAVRLQARPGEAFYFRTVVADGVPGDPGDPYGVQIDLDPDDGLLIAGEVGVYNLPSKELRGRIRRLQNDLEPAERQYGDFGKYAVGVWGYTTEFDDFFRVDGSGNPQTNSGTIGAYALAEQRLAHEPDDPFQGLSAFARIGFADHRANVVDRYAGAGLVYRGPFSREEDRLGLAVAAARLGSDYKTALRQGGDVDSWEVAVELTYRAWLTSWLSVQPDVQYVIHPGGIAALDDALVLGARIVVSL